MHLPDISLRSLLVDISSPPVFLVIFIVEELRLFVLCGFLHSNSLSVASMWCHLTGTSVLCISYKLAVESPDFTRFQFDYFVGRQDCFMGDILYFHISLFLYC